MSSQTRTVAIALCMLLLAPGIADAGSTALTTVRVAQGIDSPVLVISPPGDIERIFIVEQSGAVRIMRDGILMPRPFLDIDPLSACCGEQGLLGMAFHPDYAGNGRFFVSYSDNGGDTVVASYQVSANPDRADAGSASIVFTTTQPFTNHNGGMIAFGPDGYLYLGLGDGGSANDPGNRAQDLQEYMGKMLRFDVDSAAPYAIPPDNPFLGDPEALDEIWAYGLRNPWRFSFDSLTGDLYIGDVGQNDWEEVSFQEAGSLGGENYGWKIMEGNHCFGSPGCDMTDLVLPIHEYDHGQECSISGGFVYRGCAIPDLQGTYFFADYCSARIWSLRYDGVGVTEFTDRTAELAPAGASINLITGFGQDGLGELYITDQGGEVFKIVAAETTGPDCNGDLIPDTCKDPLSIAPDGPLVAGGPNTFHSACGAPGANLRLALSASGPGAFSTPAGTLDLNNPRLLGQAQADATGAATFNIFLPPGVSGRTLWWQAIQSQGGATTNVGTDTAQ